MSLIMDVSLFRGVLVEGYNQYSTSFISVHESCTVEKRVHGTLNLVKIQ